MSDLNTLTDEELIALSKKRGAGSDVQANQFLSELSDEQLIVLYKKPQLQTKWSDLTPDQSKSHKKAIGRGFAEGAKSMFRAIPALGGHLEQMDKSNPEFMTNVSAGMLTAPKGVTAGFIDEIAGGVLGEGATDKLRFADETIAAEFPKSHTAGEIIGGSAAGGSALAKTGIVKGGAIAGAAFGAGTAEGGLKERTIGAVKGAVGGALFGGVLKGLGAIAQPVIKSTLGKITGGKKLSTAAEVKARNIIVKAAMDKGMKKAEIKKIMEDVSKQGGDDAMLWQRLDLVNEAKGFAVTRSNAQEFAAEQISRAKALQKPRIKDAMSKAVDGKTYAAAQDDIAARLSETKKIYKDVLSQDMVISPKLKDILKDPYVKSVSKSVNRMVASEQRTLKRKVTDAERLNIVKKALDDKINKLMRKTGGRNEARIVRAVKNELLDEMDAALPAYKDARMLWGGQAANDTAMIQGRKFSSMYPSDMKKLVGKMSESEKRHYTIGVIDDLSRKLNRKADGADGAKLLNDDIREKLQLLVPKEKADAFMAKFAKERVIRAKLEGVDPFSGAQTQPRQVASEYAKDLTRSTIGRGAQKVGEAGMQIEAASVYMSPVRLPARALRYIGKNLSKEDEEVIEAVTRTLFADSPINVKQGLSSAHQTRVDHYLNKVWPTSAGVMGVEYGEEVKNKITGQTE